MNLNLVSRDVDGLAVHRAGAPLRLRQPDAAHRHPAVHQLRHVGEGVADRRAGNLRAQRARTSTPTRRGAACSRSPSRAGYSHNAGSYDFRIFEGSGEDVLRLSADATGSQWLTFRATWELSSKTGTGLDEELLTRHRRAAGAASLRHRQPGPRQVHRPGGHRAERLLDLQRLGGPGQGRLRRELLRPAGVDVQDDVPLRRLPPAQRLRRRRVLQLRALRQASRPSRSASPDATFNDPNRDWTTDSTERVHYFSIYATPPRIGRNTEARLAYDISDARGDYLYGDRARRPPAGSRHSCPKCSTSCSSSTSTCGTG